MKEADPKTGEINRRIQKITIYQSRDTEETATGTSAGGGKPELCLSWRLTADDSEG